MVRSTRSLLLIFAFTMSILPAVASAQDAKVWLACTPTPAAIQRCEASGRQFDTLRCRCLKPVSISVPLIQPCGLVCVEGVLDDKTCRCIKR